MLEPFFGDLTSSLHDIIFMPYVRASTDPGRFLFFLSRQSVAREFSFLKVVDISDYLGKRYDDLSFVTTRMLQKVLKVAIC